MKPSNNKLSAILFSDIAGYSALMEKDINAAMSLLDRYFDISQSVVQKFGGRIVKTYGDGSMITFSSAVQAVGCAEELQLRCLIEPRIPLRIGLHVGEVIEKDGDVFGSAINIASRIESMSVPGGVLFSKNIYDQIRNEPRFSTTEIGAFEFKNILQPIEVFALTNHRFPVPERKAVAGKLRVEEKKSKSLPLLVAGVLCLSILGFFGYKFVGSSDKVHVVELKNTEVEKKNSIAILPFDNMSANEENQYFTDGMHDDLLTFLSKSKNLKVISRSSVSKMKDSDQNLKDIAKLLNVSHVMEGSVQRVGDRVRINVQLIDATSDVSLWAETYDNLVTAKNIFDIQSEIATKISNTLIASVFADDVIVEPSQYTESLKAYENFLRAKQLKESGNREALYEAKELLDEAILLDNDFAEAIILLGNLHIHLIYYAGEDPDINYPKAWDYMKQGMAIKPELSDAHVLKGSLNHWWKRNFEDAKIAYDQAISLNPNNYAALYGLAIATQDLNLDVKAINVLIQQALAINPLNLNLINLRGIYQRENNEIDEALRTFKKGIELEPDHANLWFNYAKTFYFNSRIDSVAIISYNSMQINGKEGKMYSTYLESLMKLMAYEELNTELSTMETESRQQQITKLQYQRAYFIQKLDYQNAEQITNQLIQLKARKQDTNSKHSSLLGDLMAFENAFVQRKYTEAIDQYETIFADVDPMAIVTDYSQNDLSAMINYIYALKQTGKADKADALIDIIRKERIDQPKDNMRLNDILYEDFLRSAFAIFKGDNANAIKYLDSFISKGNLGSARWIDKEPLFDSLKGNKEFEDMLGKYKTKLSQQLYSFRQYLAESTPI